MENEYKPITVKITNYKKGIIKEPKTLILAHQYGSEYQTEGLMQIHIFEALPFVRNIPNNKEWFEKDIFSFN